MYRPFVRKSPLTSHPRLQFRFIFDLTLVCVTHPVESQRSHLPAVVFPPPSAGFALDYKDESVEGLISLRERLDNPDHSVLYKTCSELTKVSLLTSQFLLY